MNLHSRLLYFLLFPLFILSFQLKAQTVTINLSEEYQTIRGFGGMNHTTWIRDLNEDNREKAFGNDPGEIGLSILRCHLDPNSANWEREVATSRHALDNGAIVFATPWNAPESMLDASASNSRVDPATYGDYVSHLNSFDSFMENNEVPLYAISIQNEPDYGEWTRWTSNEMLDFLVNHAQGINNKVIAPESFQFRRAYTDPLLNNSSSAANLEIVGGHIYGGGLFDYPLAREKGKEVWMTEHLLGSNDPSDNDWNLALTFGKEISDCMEANFNAYIYWYIRRFYGLITDDGNIANKGYVISHYAKFIRNGAVRVGVDDSSPDQLDITAFKTDTSLVIVAVNRNSTDIDLDFSIPSAHVSSMTQFTSSESRDLLNDATHALSDDAFSATIDARSVTTFTSYAGNGGKISNAIPVANAGEDITIEMDTGAGNSEISLDASSSNDPDGEIINYSWSLDGQQIAWEASTVVNVEIGEYELVLTVTDNDGARDMDTLSVIIASSNSDEIWIEAECGTVGDTWRTSTDVNASQGYYIATLNGEERLDAASEDPDDLVVYDFETTEAGNFKVWGRVNTPSADDDSFWVKVDDSEWAMWNSIPTGSSWHWDDVHDQGSGGNAVIYNLEPGAHTLYFCMREDGAWLDKILIANTGLSPDGTGGDAEGCINGYEEETIRASNESSIAIYPNPSSGSVNIEWKSEFILMQILDISGKTVYRDHLHSGQKELYMQTMLDPGVYFVVLKGRENTGVSKFMIH